jgi:hypothetical protein
MSLIDDTSFAGLPTRGREMACATRASSASLPRPRGRWGEETAAVEIDVRRNAGGSSGSLRTHYVRCRRNWIALAIDLESTNPATRAWTIKDIAGIPDGESRPSWEYLMITSLPVRSADAWQLRGI